jgi:hypothetical protein
VNGWSAETCLSTFEQFAKKAFKARKLGWLARWSVTRDSYYDPKILENTLKETFGATHGTYRQLLGDSAVVSPAAGEDEKVLRLLSLKVGVTAVTTYSETFILANYRRDTSDGK